MKKDVILIAGLILVGIVAGLVLMLSRQGGKTVQVRVSGNVIQSFSLSENVEYEITGKNGGRNLLVIREGTAWIEDADCPDKLCKNMGKIHLAGQSVVCLPHEVVVEILRNETQNGMQDIDIIAE